MSSPAKSRPHEHAAYDKIAATYDLLAGPLLQRSQRKLFSSLHLAADQKILEIGVGTGLTLPLYPRDVHLVGLDISSVMLNKAEARARDLGMNDVKLVTMSAEELAYDANSYDRVIAPSVLSVVKNPDKVIREMVRVCKPGGLIGIVAHFEGRGVISRLFDRIFEPWTLKFYDFRMTTPASVVENCPGVTIVEKRTLLGNFNTVYILKKL